MALCEAANHLADFSITVYSPRTLQVVHHFPASIPRTRSSSILGAVRGLVRRILEGQRITLRGGRRYLGARQLQRLSLNARYLFRVYIAHEGNRYTVPFVHATRLGPIAAKFVIFVTVVCPVGLFAFQFGYFRGRN
jgi:hypothetical protein